MGVMLIGYECPYCKVIHILCGEWTIETEMEFARAREQHGEVKPFREAFGEEIEGKLEELFKMHHDSWQVFDPTKIIRDQRKLNLAQNIYDIRRTARNN